MALLWKFRAVLLKSRGVCDVLQHLQVYLVKRDHCCHCAQQLKLSSNVTLENAYEPHISTKEPHIPTKEPHISTKEPHIPTKEPHIPTKEPHISSDF